LFQHFLMLLLFRDGGHCQAVVEGFPGFVVAAAAVPGADDCGFFAVYCCDVSVLQGAGQMVEGVDCLEVSGVSVDGVYPYFVEADEDFYGVFCGAVGVGDFGWVEVGPDWDCGGVVGLAGWCHPGCHSSESIHWVGMVQGQKGPPAPGF
jgi:hypothetical protein